MDRVSFLVAFVATGLILCQWFVFISVRKYLFQRYDDVTRKVAYPVLLLLSLLNFIGIRLAFYTDVFEPDSLGKQLSSIIYFSYLGFILVLTGYFLVLGLLSQLLELKDFVLDLLQKVKRNPYHKIKSERGCLRSFSSDAHETNGVLDEKIGIRSNAVSDRNVLTKIHDEISVGANALPPGRRAFLKWTAATGLVVITGYSGYGVAEGYQKPRVEEYDLFHKKLEGISRPITFIQITDFHFGMFFGPNELQKLVDQLNSIEADALFITGDVFHSPLTVVEHATPLLKKLKSRRFGNLAVLGNHDFYAGEWRSAESFKESGLILLRDQWVTFKDGSCEIQIGGIDDPMVNWVWGAEFPNFEKLMRKAPDSGMKILLSHRPGALAYAARTGIDLVVSGHVHGGQIILPSFNKERGISIASLVSNYTHGWYTEGLSQMYLNRGVGLTFLPWRINCPPEIAVIHIRPCEGRSASGTFMKVKTQFDQAAL